jgi:hypothetical protein
MLRSFVLHHSIIQGIQTTTTKITNTQLSKQWTSIERIVGLQWSKGTVVPGESPRQWLGAPFSDNSPHQVKRQGCDRIKVDIH